MITETYQQRHKNIDKEMKAEARRVFNKTGIKPFVVCGEIAKGKNVSAQTIYNYATGSGKDGFLKEDVLAELKRL